MNSTRYVALIPAAGVGARMGAKCPKQYLPIASKPMLAHVIETFARSDRIDHVYVVVSADDGYVDKLLADLQSFAEKVTLFRQGGETRRDSVLNGLNALESRVGESDWVLVHDAARPGLTGGLIEKLIDRVGKDPVGGLLALPVVDTLKRSGPDERSKETIPREGLWAAQTPQMFRYGLLRCALQQAERVTDEASAIEALGLQPLLVEGDARNFKITLPGDIAAAELYLKDQE